MSFNNFDKMQLLELLHEFMQHVESIPATQPCATCVNWDFGICKLADATPPKEILLVGCESYAFDPTQPPF